MYVHSPGVSYVFIAPYVVQKLFPGEDLVGGGSQEVEKLQLLRRHIHGLPLVQNGVVGLVDDQIGIFHIFSVGLGNRLAGSGLKTAEYRLNPRDQLFGVKGLNNVIIRAQLQPQHLIKNLSLGGKHDDRCVGLMADLPADLVAVHARKHQIQQDQVGLEGAKDAEGFFAVVDDHAFKAFFCQVKRNEFCYIVIIIYDENFLFGNHS